MSLAPFAALSAAAAAGDLAAISAALARVTVRLSVGGAGEGSGVLWRSDGLVITNAHVARTSTARVRVADGETLVGSVVARDPRVDLAALLVPGEHHRPPPLGAPEDLAPGSLVLAFGHPLGVENALALGIVHHVACDDAGRPRWIRADVRLAPGNSGGPLADARGQVVGINTLVADRLGYAVPVGVVTRFLARAGLAAPGRRAA